jgi:hypothetical protein
MLNGIDGKDGFEQINALIRFYFGVVPKNVDEFAKLWGQLEFALQFDGKMKKKEVKIID